MANVEKVIIDKSGIGYGSRGTAGVIKIFTRRTPLFKKGQNKTPISSNSFAPYAFKPLKKFYTPKYSSFQNDTYESYGVISWIPELELATTQSINFKIFDTKTKSITLFIEGISENGDLISEKKTIQVR